MNSIAIFLVRIVALFNSFSSLEQSGLVFVLHLIDLVYAVSLSFILPQSYSALDGDLVVQVLQNNPMSSSNLLYLQLFRLNKTDKIFLKRIKFAPDINKNNINTTNTTVTHINIGCQYFLFGGEYQLQLMDEDADDNNTSQELNAYENFQVEWLKPKLNVSSLMIPTYPDEHIKAQLTFPTGKCRKRRLATAEKPEFWLEVLYCRPGFKCNNNVTLTHTVYTEQVKFLQNKTSFNLSCDLFGMAGQYEVQVRPLSQTYETLLSKVTIQADWNDKFVFNVIDRFIMPCDEYDRVGVLFTYPSCIDFIIRDRIRIYGKLQENALTINPPTRLEPIYDEIIEVNQHKKYFNCEIFSEKYVEYCFAYITQAIFGPIAEIRMDCVPTFPINPWDHGGWGPWSEWTPCSSTCPGGQSHRYRFCDSPVPRYGARYCEGKPVETKECGQNSTTAWECLYEDSHIAVLNGNYGNYTASFENEDISKCICGCLVELYSKNETKIIASSMKSCSENKLFWIIQTNETERIKVIMEYVGLPCLNQYIRIRNGFSGTSDLIGEYKGIAFNRSQQTVSTDNGILIEFFWSSEPPEDVKCNGRFLARITLLGINETKAITILESDIFRLKEVALIQIFAFIFGALIVTMSTILVLNYLFKYRQYKLAQSIEYYSPAHTPHMSVRSLPNNEEAPAPSRAVSTTTLISEVVYFVKMRRRTEIKHKILRESTISEKSQHMSDSKSQDRQPGGSLTSGSSQSTQTIYRVVCPVSHHDDLSSVASFPCYKPKRVDFKCPEQNIKTICKAKDSLLRSHSSKEEADDVSIKSSSAGEAQGGYLSNAGSDATLTSGHYSTPAGTINTATIRATNQKECKDKKNLEKLLSRPQSEFSLGNPEDFELDYYDYNVLNTADVPGSYLGMDPAYLIWIPPFEEESSFSKDPKEIDDEKDILPRYQSIDTGSNKESPSSHDEDNLSPTPSLIATQKRIERACHITNNLYHGVVLAVDDEGSPKIKSLSSNNSELVKKIENKEKDDGKPDGTGEEKETVVMKSPCRDLNSFYDADDIQFVDD